jgi:hypothetical protein
MNPPETTPSALLKRPPKRGLWRVSEVSDLITALQVAHDLVARLRPICRNADFVASPFCADSAHLIWYFVLVFVSGLIPSICVTIRF